MLLQGRAGLCRPSFAYGYVGAVAHIGPLGSCEFAADFRKNSAFCRADVGIGPYNTVYFPNGQTG